MFHAEGLGGLAQDQPAAIRFFRESAACGLDKHVADEARRECEQKLKL